MALRIAYNTGEYPRATDTFIQREVAALRQLGVDVTTFSIRETDIEHHVGPEQRIEAANTFYVQPAARSPLRLLGSHFAVMTASPRRYFSAARLAWSLAWPGLNGFIRATAYFLEAGVLADELRRRRIGHLHNHFASSSCSVAALATKMSGIGLSFTEHGPATFFEPAKWRIDLKAKQALFVAAISDFCRSQLMLFAGPSDWPKIHVVHCGVNPELFEARKHLNPARRVLFVGRLSDVKGVSVLLDAWTAVSRDFPSVQLTLAGDGPERAPLERKARNLGLENRIDFVGFQSQSQVRDHMRQCDVLVLPSFAEGVPVVLMEAMAAGVPVVATRVGGVCELVEDGRSGFVVAPGNADVFASAIAQLLSNAALREQFGAAGRAVVQREFDVLKEAEKLVRLFGRFCAESAPADASVVDVAPAVRKKPGEVENVQPATGMKKANALG